MPMLQRPDGQIYYEEFGSGFPILLFAPGGLRSNLAMWHHPANGPQRSWCDWTDALASKYRVVAMDQRNAGQSKCAIRGDHGWHTYAADHLALMDHLGHRKFHGLGGCIGG
ncbi:MAG TPA: alpha/beta hydrolase, partial [Acetobacteraceae bacterium]|nr:alpha/beta hydrolase [Acetobacteraceae bacterium]